jgi:hypothetical protein
MILRLLCPATLRTGRPASKARPLRVNGSPIIPVYHSPIIPVRTSSSTYHLLLTTLSGAS